MKRCYGNEYVLFGYPREEAAGASLRIQETEAISERQGAKDRRSEYALTGSLR